MAIAFPTTIHICNMKTDAFQLLFVILFLMICGYQTCSKINFIQGSERVVTSENSIVNITFQLDTQQCPLNQTHYTIIISRLTNGSHVDVCKISLTKKCTPSSSSRMCTCLSPHRLMVFSKKVESEDNNTVFIWKWTDTLLGAQHAQVTFQIYNTYTSTEETTRSGYHPSLTIVFGSFAAGVGLLVITAAVTTTCIIIRRVGGGRYGNSQLSSDTCSSPSTHAPSEVLASDNRDQTTDIYEEVQDSSELHIQHRVDREASCKSGVKPPRLRVHHKSEGSSGKGQIKSSEIPTYSGGYLHPFYLPSEQLTDEKEPTTHDIKFDSFTPKLLNNRV